MSDVSATTGTARNPTADSGRVSRGGASTDTRHDQNAPTQPASQEPEAPTSGPAHSDPAVILSSTLTHLQAGQRFAATIIGQMADGRLVMDSARGVFVVDLKTSLALGPLAAKTSILLQVVNVGEDIEAAVVAMNGVHVHPPRPVLLTLADIHGNPAPAEAAPTPPTPLKPALPQTTVAEEPAAEIPVAPQAKTLPPVAKPDAPETVAVPTATPAAKPSHIGQVLEVEPATATAGVALKAGTKLKLTIVSVEQSPEPAPRPASAEPVAASKLPPLSSLLQRAPSSAAAPSAPPPKIGTTVQATVVARPATAPQPVSTPPATQAAPTESDLLQTPFGLVRVTQGPKLPAGTKVTIQVSEVRSPQPPVPTRRPPFDDAGLAVTDLTRDWSGLKQALKAAEFNPPPTMQGHVVAPALAANPPPTPAGSLLFLLAALRFGDVKGWLGQVVADQIQQGLTPAALTQLGDQFSSLSRAAHGGGGSEWRPFVLPIHDGSGIQPVAWFIRRPYDAPDEAGHGGGGEQGCGDQGTRFVIELDHRSLGELQLDGLVHTKRFDLVVRSHQPLSQTIRQDIAGLFKTALETGGFDGEVMFHAGRQFPVSLRADMAHRAFEARPHPERA